MQITWRRGEEAVKKRHNVELKKRHDWLGGGEEGGNLREGLV